MIEQTTYAPPPSPAPAANAFFIKFKVKPGKNAKFEKAMSDMMAGVRRQDPGNAYCELLHLAQDSQTWTIVERFADAQAVKVHAESAYIQRLGEVFQKDELLEGAPEVQELIYIRSK